jgi:hypothetical protein
MVALICTDVPMAASIAERGKVDEGQPMSAVVPKSATTDEWLIQLPLNDRTYKRLAGFASRLARLLDHKKASSNPHVLSILDDLLGGIYALALARYCDFEDRTMQSIQVSAVKKRAQRATAGVIRLDGKWTAGFHFNSALFRVDALYHRALLVAVGRPSSISKEYVPALRPEAKRLFLKWKDIEWTHGHLDAIHQEVIDLKHVPKGKYFQRKVKYAHAVSGVDELLTLLEAWGES